MRKILCNCNIQKHFPKTKVEQSQEPEYICKVKGMECWLSISIKTATKVPDKRLDLIIWNQEKVVCTVIDYNYPLDSNITKEVPEKKTITDNSFVICR